MVVQKYLRLILGMLLALVVGEGLIRVLDPWTPEPSVWPTVETELKHRQIQAGGPFGVIFLGSSVTEAAVDPALLSIDSYNAALPFSTPISNELWLRTQFDVSPDTLVVMGLPAWPFHDGPGEDPLAAGIAHATDSRALPGVNKIELIASRGLLADWNSNQVRANALAEGFWTTRGHQTAYYDQFGGSIRNRVAPFGAPVMGEGSSAAIRRISEYLHEARAELILMIEPGRFPGSVEEDAVDTYLRSIHSLADQLGLEVWDTYSLPWDRSLFADEAHFNRRGTEIFTALLQDHLDTWAEKRS